MSVQTNRAAAVMIPLPRNGKTRKRGSRTVTRAIPARSDEDPRFRRRVNRALRRALLDDEYELFAAGGPTVIELPRTPGRQLAELLARTSP